MYAYELTEGSKVVLRDGGSCLGPHIVAAVRDSHWPDHLVLFFTDGCQMYAVPDDAEFAPA